MATNILSLDFDQRAAAIRERVHAEAGECPVCCRPVHPANLAKHCELHHPERIVKLWELLPSTLTDSERDAREHYEQDIETGLAALVKLANALQQIRDQRLYRDTHKTFEAYIKDRWNKGRSWAYNLISALGVYEAVSPLVDKMPDMNERQLRALGTFEEELRPAILRLSQAAAKALDKDLSSGLITRTGEIFLEATQTGAVDIGDGSSNPIINAIAQGETEAIIRKWEHISSQDKKQRTYHLKNEQYTVSAKGVVMLTDLPAGATVSVSVWSEC